MRAWGISTRPTACARASRRRDLWGWRGGVPGDGASRRQGVRLKLGAHPLPAARPGSGWSGSAARVPWARVCGCGDPVLPCRLLRTLGVAGGCPWGRDLSLLRGASGVRRSPSPARASLEQAARPRCPCVPGTGVVSVGGQQRPNSVRSCMLWGWREGIPLGGAPRCSEERLKLGGRPPPAARLLGGWLGSGSAAHVLWTRVCGCGDLSLPLWRACPVACCAPRGQEDVSPGGGGLSPL